MAKDVPSTSVHRGPIRPEGVRGRPALLCAFPRAAGLAVPDSGAAVGRAWLAEHGLADTEVSTEHLRFDRAGGGLRVADAGSRNGTWVDGTRLAPGDVVPLETGAVLRLGRTILVVEAQLQGPLEPAPPLGELVGPFGLRALQRAVTGLASSRPSNVLIEGETGVGKELSAHAVAEALEREQPFAAVNVAGVAAGVFESQMFGHVAGAFSGAGSAAAGIVVAHDGGTLFLDEIGELPPELQPKLLRLLENREVLPVGAERSVQVDVLVIAASNRPMEEMVEQGSFRRDLFARLAMARIHVPALRERRGDIYALSCALGQRAGAPLAEAEVEVEAVERLLLEPWPGNVRELSATLAAIHQLDPDPGLRLWALEDVLGPRQAGPQALTRARAEAAIEAAGGNVSAAAKQLGVSRGKLLRMRKRFGA